MTWTEVEAAAARIEEVLDRTPEIDRWCSGPDWVLPVHAGFAPDADRLLFRGRDGVEGYALLARYELEDGTSMVAGLEPLWGFATPVFGPDIEAVAGALRAVLDGLTWDVLVLPGIPPPGGPASFAVRLARALGPLGELRVGEGIVRQVADLGEGPDAWLARRSNRFRRNLRRAGRLAEETGLRIVDARHDPEAVERIMGVERRSWKAREDSGLTSPEMAATYEAMVRRLAGQGRLRLGIAVLDGTDVGYILGGVRGRTYRGLQLSFAATVGSLSVGHLLQRWQIESLASEGVARYDLGMDMDYKRRWADRAEASLTLVIHRRPEVSSAETRH